MRENVTIKSIRCCHEQSYFRPCTKTQKVLKAWGIVIYARELLGDYYIEGGNYLRCVLHVFHLKDTMAIISIIKINGNTLVETFLFKNAIF